MVNLEISGAPRIAKRVSEEVSRHPDLDLGGGGAVEVVCHEAGGAEVRGPDGATVIVPDVDRIAVHRVFAALGEEPIRSHATVLTHSRLADSLEPVFDGDECFQRVLVPCSTADVLLLKLDFGSPPDPAAAVQRLRSAPRIIVGRAEDGFPDTAKIREFFRDAGRRRGDRRETFVWEESVESAGESLFMTLDVDPLAGSVPEILDAILERAGGAV